MLRRWHICRFYPLCHHLATGKVLRQSFETVAIAAEDDGCPGDDHATADEGKRSTDGLAFSFPCRGVALCEDRFLHYHDDAQVKLNQFNKVTSDDFIKLLKSAIRIFLDADFCICPADGLICLQKN